MEKGNVMIMLQYSVQHGMILLEESVMDMLTHMMAISVQVRQDTAGNIQIVVGMLLGMLLQLNAFLKLV